MFVVQGNTKDEWKVEYEKDRKAAVSSFMRFFKDIMQEKKGGEVVECLWAYYVGGGPEGIRVPQEVQERLTSECSMTAESPAPSRMLPPSSPLPQQSGDIDWESLPYPLPAIFENQLLYLQEDQRRIAELFDGAWEVDAEATEEVGLMVNAFHIPDDSEDPDSNYSGTVEERRKQRKKVARKLLSLATKLCKNIRSNGGVHYVFPKKLWDFYVGPEHFVSGLFEVPGTVQARVDDLNRSVLDGDGAWSPRKSSSPGSSPTPRNYVGKLADDDDQASTGSGSRLNKTKPCRTTFRPANLATKRTHITDEGPLPDNGDKLPDNVEDPAEASTVDLDNRCSGQYSKETLTKSFAAKERFINEITELALSEGKSVHSLMKAIGYGVMEERGLNSWNIYQAWTTAEDGGGVQRESGETKEEFQERLLLGYNEWKEGEKFEHQLKSLRKWYMGKMNEFAKVGNNGRPLTSSQLRSLTSNFIHRAEMLWLTHGVIVCGYTIEPERSKVIHWGAGKPYEIMRLENATLFEAQKTDLGSLIHVAWMKANGNHVLPHEKLKIMHVDLSNRNEMHRAWTSVMLLSLREANPRNGSTQMAWGSAFANMCYENRVRLVNWNPKVPIIGLADGCTDISKIKVEPLKEYVEAWKKYLEWESEYGGTLPLFEDEGDELKGRLLRFEPWTNDEVMLPVDEQGDIPLVKARPTSSCPGGKALCSVRDSTTFQTRFENVMAVEGEDSIPIRGRKQHRVREGEDEGSATKQRPTRKRHAAVQEELVPNKKRLGKKRRTTMESEDESEDGYSQSPQAKTVTRRKAVTQQADDRESEEEEPPKKRRQVKDASESRKRKRGQGESNDDEVDVRDEIRKTVKLPVRTRRG